MEKSENIVMEWLKSLSLSQHGSSFIDNGYDDLEICKKIGDQDLDAIGVLNVCERMRILDAVNNLKLNGGTSVYLAIEEHMKKNKCNSPASSDKTRSSSRPNSMSSEERCCSGSSKEIYQESTCGDLTRIPVPKLQRLIKDKLRQDGIKLFNPPYSSVNGDRGYLEGLASHYADDLKTFYSDVLNVLEEIRVEEWKNMSPRMMVLQDGISSVPILPSTGISGSSHGVTSVSQMSLETPQTIYAPGKYSPSSCLSHCEEDVIYGFGGDRTNSGACMFPFGEKAATAHKKKPGGISKLLRTLRVRREKSPRHLCQPHTRQGRKTVSQNCKTMTVVYPRPALLTADPKTQRRRVLQMARDGELSLEEAMAWLRISRIEESRSAGIYCNTKDQTVKYLKYSARSHSQSPAHTHANSVNAPQTCCCQIPGFSSQACEAVVHWYDEPSYENQDEYFLRRNCLKNNDSCEAISPCCTQESDVISLPSAGDIALGRHGQVYTRESPIGSSGRISSEELLCSNELAGFSAKDKCCNIPQWNRNCWDTGDYIRQRSVRDSGDYAGSDSRSLSISSLEDAPSSHVIGRCRALIDIPQDSRDSSFLSLKKGETVDILSTRPDGLWVGRTSQGTGTLLASTVEVLNVGRSTVAGSTCCSSRHCVTLNEQGGTFSAIKNVLKTFGCEEHLALLISNGYDDLEALRNLELSDLDLLGIRDPQSRANLLLVVRYLHQTVDVQTRPVFSESRQSVRSNFPVGCSTNYREPKDSTVGSSGRAKRPTFLQQYNIPVSQQRCCGQDYVNGELCSSANPDTTSLLGRLQLADNPSRDPPREEERDTFGDFGKRYGSEKSSDSGISVRSRSPAVQSPGQKSDGVFSSKRFIKQNSHQNLMS